MKKVFFVLSSITFLCSSCLHSFKKSTGGLEYKIFSDGTGQKIEKGNFFEIRFDLQYKDSQKDTTLQSSKDYGDQIGVMDSMSIPPAYYKIFSQLRNTDSVIIRILTDSVIKTGQAPPFFKKGEYIVGHYKIVNVFTQRAQADSAFKAQRAIIAARDSVEKIAQLAIDSKTIADYLAKNNITTVKGQEGTYVEIKTPGTGDKIDTGNEVIVNYTGKTFDGTVFDSNTDPKLGHVKPLPVKMWLTGQQGGVITGWTDGIKLLSKGAKATLYIPSPLAYGKRGAGGKIKPNANLIFDVEVLDVLTRAQAQAKDDADRKQQEEQRKHYMDSVTQARKDTMNKIK
jgi:FKBP-type peptidyl-prolyl cis-trans isomerase FkpA